MDHVVNNLFLLEHSNMKNPYVSRPLERRTKTSHENSLKRYTSRMTVKMKAYGFNRKLVILVYSKECDSLSPDRWFLI